MRDSRQDVLVLGLGNTLLADDGVGIHVVRRLAAGVQVPGLTPCDGGTLGFRLLGELTGAEAVLIVDAAELGAAPGTIRLIKKEILIEHTSRAGKISAHEAGLLDLLTMARLHGWAPSHLALLGIQPLLVDWGDRLSEPVAQSLPAACDAAVRIVQTWQDAA